jgi:hypothetical protein
MLICANATSIRHGSETNTTSRGGRVIVRFAVGNNKMHFE